MNSHPRKITRTAYLISITLFPCMVLFTLSCEEADYVMWPNPVDVMWERTYDLGRTRARSMLIDDDGGVVVAGNARDGRWSGAFIMKTDPQGDSLWASRFDGDGQFQVYSVAQCPDHGYLLMGNRYLDLGTESKVYLIKADSVGQKVWSKPISGDQQPLGYSLTAIGDGSFVVVGSVGVRGYNNQDLYLARIDVNGDTLWTRAIDDSNNNNYGRSVILTLDNNLMIAGYTGEPGSYSQGQIWLAKVDLDGTLLWSREYSSSGCTSYGTSIIESQNGDLYLAGRSKDTLSKVTSGVIIRTNASGALVWSKKYGQSRNCMLSGIAEASPSRIVAVGESFSLANRSFEAYIVAVDRKGRAIREMTLGDDRRFEAGQLDGVSLDQSGNILAAGSKNYDVYLVKLDAGSLQ